MTVQAAIALSADQPVMMSQLEDRITVTLMEKKQLKSTKRVGESEKGRAGGDGKREGESASSSQSAPSPLGKVLRSLETFFNHFHENMRILVEEYDVRVMKKEVFKTKIVFQIRGFWQY